MFFCYADKKNTLMVDSLFYSSCGTCTTNKLRCREYGVIHLIIIHIAKQPKYGLIYLLRK